MKLTVQQVRLPLEEFTLELEFTLEQFPAAIFGPSGAGKTTLLDLIAGLRHPTQAHIQLGDTILTDTRAGIHLPPRFRNIGYVPQDLALFPHLSVQQNILYGTKPDTSHDSLFQQEHVIEVLEIKPLLSRGVGHLSGGEKQRVALARALATSPRLLLLDEPLASLDAALKSKIIPYFHRIRDEFKVPMLYVTHDPDEVLALCHEVLLMERGQIAGRGTPEKLLSRPK